MNSPQALHSRHKKNPRRRQGFQNATRECDLVSTPRGVFSSQSKYGSPFASPARAWVQIRDWSDRPEQTLQLSCQAWLASCGNVCSRDSTRRSNASTLCWSARSRRCPASSSCWRRARARDPRWVHPVELMNHKAQTKNPKSPYVHTMHRRWREGSR